MSDQLKWQSGQSVPLQIKNGQTVWLRPLERSDVSLLLNLFDHMSADSRYNRFHTPLANPDPDYVYHEALRLADVPPTIGRAWLIFSDTDKQPGLSHDDLVIGGARFLFLPDSDGRQAEISIAVRDDWQGIGIGSAVLQFVAEEAKRIGVTLLVADVLTQNQAVMHVLGRLTYPVSYQTQDGETQIQIRLDQSQTTPIKKLEAD